MKPQQTIPLLSTLGSVALALPPVAIVGALVCVGLWLLSKDDTANRKAPAPEKASPVPEEIADDEPNTPLASQPSATAKRITREDLAEALNYGAQPFSRKEAVEALQSLGFGKTAAYKAVSSDGRFHEFLEYTQDGLIEWKG